MATRKPPQTTKSATKQRQTTAKKPTQRQTAQRQTPARKGKKVVKMRKKQNPLIKEVISILLLSMGVLLCLTFASKSGGGALGVAVSGFLKGLFGIGALFLPFVLLFFGVYLFFLKEPIRISKVVLTKLIFLNIITFFHIVSSTTAQQDLRLLEFVKYYYSNALFSNGGLFGAVFGNILTSILGNVGAYIVIFASTIIYSIFLTGKSLAGAAQSLMEAFGEKYGDEWEEYEEDEQDDEYPQHAKKRQIPPLLNFGDKKNKNKEQIEYVNEELENGEESVTVLAKSKGKTFLNLEKTNDTDHIAHPVMSEINIKMQGIADDEFDENAGQFSGTYIDENGEILDKPTKEVFVATSATSQPLQPNAQFLESGENVANSQGANSQNANSQIATPQIANPQALIEETQLSIKEYSVNRPPAARANLTPTFAGTNGSYTPPPIDLLRENPASQNTGSRAQILENSKKLEETLKSFGVEAKVIAVSKGPSVTRYELSPGVGVKVSKISGLADDLALNLAAAGIRIEAPIPGKAAVGIEVPNKEVTPVFLREVLDDEIFLNFPSKLAFGLGKDIAGNTVVADIAKMPHLLIAGATGSGKSVCINTLITSIIYKANPDEVKLLMVDPKVVELSIYNGIPHLLIPVVTDPKKAAGALNWAVTEMITRYNLFAETSVRDLKGYNDYIKDRGEGNYLPQIVIIIDELADLMMAAPGEVEDAICRLAQMARAAGLHLIIATQRPSVDVITGLIKANVPSRLAFSVSSGTDSRTILDMVGAEKLLGKGDMLFNPVGMGKPLRVQGALITDKEVEAIVEFVKKDCVKEYDPEMIEKITAAKVSTEDIGELDEFFVPAVEFLLLKQKGSASLLQRQFRIGYNRASRLIEDLETHGIVGPEDGSKPRKVIITYSQWTEKKNNY